VSLSDMRKLVSFVESIQVGSALTLAFLVSLAWVLALGLLLRTTAPTHSPVNAEANSPPQQAIPLTRPGSSSK
jgi:hypothetical protein